MVRYDRDGMCVGGTVETAKNYSFFCRFGKGAGYGFDLWWVVGAYV